MSSYSKTIICLANSRKQSGRCVAGKVHENNVCSEWVRPTSAREHQEISEDERSYENGNTAQLLDIIRITFIQPKPATYQQENHLIDHGYYWTLVRQATQDDLENAVDVDFTPLWLNSGDDSYHGRSDRMSLDQANSQTSSLAFIKPENLSIRVSAEIANFGSNKRTVRARFDWHDEHYRITVTDPFITKWALAQPDGEHNISDAFMCVSLGEPCPHDNRVYKLAASIITPDRVDQ